MTAVSRPGCIVEDYTDKLPPLQSGEQSGLFYTSVTQNLCYNAGSSLVLYLKFNRGEKSCKAQSNRPKTLKQGECNEHSGRKAIYTHCSTFSRIQFESTSCQLLHHGKFILFFAPEGQHYWHVVGVVCARMDYPDSTMTRKHKILLSISNTAV